MRVIVFFIVLFMCEYGLSVSRLRAMQGKHSIRNLKENVNFC
jgi:hypothetical protein